MLMVMDNLQFEILFTRHFNSQEGLEFKLYEHYFLAQHNQLLCSESIRLQISLSNFFKQKFWWN